MKIAYLVNASLASGVGYYAAHLRNALRAVDSTVSVDEFMVDGTTGQIKKNGQVAASIMKWPGPLGAKTITWIRSRKVLQKQLEQSGPYHVYHATNQTLSFMVEQDKPWVVTVHDVIELTEPQTMFGKLTARYLYQGIPVAKQLISVSDFTSQETQRAYPLSAGKISTILNGVGEPFQQIPGFKSSPTFTELCRKFALPTSGPKILYVGSNHPRKNISTALRVFAAVREEYPDTTFIKVGSPGLKSGEVEMQQLIEQLEITKAVTVITDPLSENELAQVYNMADVLIFPSTLEGFGMPPLQAMACGLPVVASNAASIPEVVGEAALVREPTDVTGFVTDVKRVLKDTQLQTELQQKGLARAQQFQWSRIATQTLDVYRKAQV